jgi:AcrR family transcriptional regulator
LKTQSKIRRPRSEAKREHLIEAGKRVIFRDGIWNVTTRKIAEDASINLATIHYHFANKDELLVAVFDDMLDAIRASAQRDFSKPGTLAARIEESVLRSWEYSQGNMAGQFMQMELTVYALRNGLKSLAERQLQEFLAIYLKLFNEATDVKGRTDLDIEALSRFIVAGLDGILLQHFVEPDESRSSAGCRKLAYFAQRFPLTRGRVPLTALTLKTPKSRKRAADKT